MRVNNYMGLCCLSNIFLIYIYIKRLEKNFKKLNKSVLYSNLFL